MSMHDMHANDNACRHTNRGAGSADMTIAIIRSSCRVAMDKEAELETGECPDRTTAKSPYMCVITSEGAADWSKLDHTYKMIIVLMGLSPCVNSWSSSMHSIACKAVVWAIKI